VYFLSNCCALVRINIVKKLKKPMSSPFLLFHLQSVSKNYATSSYKQSHLRPLRSFENRYKFGNFVRCSVYIVVVIVVVVALVVVVVVIIAAVALAVVVAGAVVAVVVVVVIVTTV
jgi:Flp pilus assembly protein TadB